ncbi:iron-containing alcohol dehydrogenase family protein [Amycolatopsis lurida]
MKTRVEFGVGATGALPAVVEELGHRRVFVVTDNGLRATGVLGRVLRVLERAGIPYGCYESVRANPSVSIIEEGGQVLRRYGPAAVLGVGGGSALDAAKAISLQAAGPGENGRPVIAVPTTAGTGAETNGFGVFEDAGRKVYLGHDSVRPVAVVLDPELTVGLPPRATAVTGVDALVHGIESLSSPRADSESIRYAGRAIAKVSRWLPVAVRDGANLEARAGMLLGAHLAGLALTRSGLGLVHGFGHAITARLGISHGLALSSVLEPVMRYSASVAAPAYAQVALAGGHGSAIGLAGELLDRVGVRPTLAQLGVTRDLVPELAAAALADPVTDNAPLRPSPPEAIDLLASAL